MVNNPENRSEIVLLYDAEDANPNGDPLSADNRPRIDMSTREAIVTDVRLKRYIRDQLEDDGHQIYIRNPQRSNEVAESRDELFEHLLGLEEGDDISDEYEKPSELFRHFLDRAIDVRFFGATLSFSEDMDDAFDGEENEGFDEDVSIPQYTGPLQFSHGRTLNKVIDMKEARKLSTVVTSGGDAEQGTFAIDNRLEYALVRFHGVLNENASKHTRLTQDDLSTLDKTIWRSIKNQTLTRSKMGHSPQLYLRVEFEEGFHDGSLHQNIKIDRKKSEPDEEMRNINDVTVKTDQLIDRLNELDEHVEKIVLKSGNYVTYSYDGSTGNVDVFRNELEEVAEIETPEIYNG
jgi:CRISPR-associated protein Csh2